MALLNFFRDRAKQVPPPGMKQANRSEELPARAAANPPRPSAAAREVASGLNDIYSDLQQIAAVLGRDDSGDAGTEAPAGGDVFQFAMDLSEALSLLPEECVARALPLATASTVRVPVRNVYEQLATGRVTVTLHELADVLPDDCLVDTVREKHGAHEVCLPLSQVVAAVSPAEIQRRMTGKKRTLTTAIPDLFVPAGSPSDASAPRESTPPALPRDERSAQQPPERKPEMPPAARPAPRAAFSLMIRGIDLNIASAGEIARRLPGVGPVLAERIVSDRRHHGPFTGPLDLARVHGLGARTLERITGQVYHAAPGALRMTVMDIIGESDGLWPDMRAVARRFGARSGCEACLLVHPDGHVLATGGKDAKQDALAAVAPQIVKRISSYLTPLEAGPLEAVTLFTEHRMMTLACGRRLLLVGVHGRGSIRRQIELTQSVCRELDSRLTRGL